MSDLSVVTFLASSDVLKDVFSIVAKNRSVLFKELCQYVKVRDQNEVEDAVKKLEKADLIKERSAPIKDFYTYYVTADGLTAEKQLRLAGIETAADRK
jgi:predicted MarR family transcription regulator